MYTTDNQDLDNIDKDEIRKLLGEHGVIVLRNSLEVDIPKFSALVKRVSNRVSNDPARNFHSTGSIAQQVDAGYDAVGLHIENGTTPFVPNICWFYCEVTPTQGSQTTVCDGQLVWSKSREIQTIFQDKDILYTRKNIPEHIWRLFVANSLSKDPQDVTWKELLNLSINGSNLKRRQDGSLSYKVRRSAVPISFFSGQPAFANSLVGPSYNYNAPRITFGDGTPITEDILEVVKRETEPYVKEIHWQKGDIVVIDNTRVMHGRRQIKDPKRKIYNALSSMDNP